MGLRLDRYRVSSQVDPNFSGTGRQRVSGASRLQSMLRRMEAVIRPDDGELCGHVEARDGSWYALVVFGAELGRHSTREDAVAQVLSDGLASLAERWTLLRGDEGSSQIVCIQEANAHGVTVALDYYAMPGVPTMTIASADIAAGIWSLHRESTAHIDPIPEEHVRTDGLFGPATQPPDDATPTETLLA